MDGAEQTGVPECSEGKVLVLCPRGNPERDRAGPLDVKQNHGAWFCRGIRRRVVVRDGTRPARMGLPGGDDPVAAPPPTGN